MDPRPQRLEKDYRRRPAQKTGGRRNHKQKDSVYRHVLLIVKPEMQMDDVNVVLAPLIKVV